ncbi:MAG: alkyl hydroperoxide reductase/Thiol specific antioxidant/Mal allergen [Bacteroidetes bacterium]|nr:alkyl hydroperoxide reductase/Thiol specific antioxidant/Mal allergen [Bacteroidota bacterium]
MAVVRCGYMVVKENVNFNQQCSEYIVLRACFIPMKQFLKILLLIIIGGFIGFSVNFTWSFAQNSITFTYASIVFTIAGIVQQRRSVALLCYENFILLWYILFITVFAACYNYSWDLPVVFCVSIISFVIGYLSSALWKSSYTGKSLLALWIISIISFNLIVVPWYTFKSAVVPVQLNSQPTFELMNLKDATKLKNDDLKGKVIFLDFWNIHCGVCIKEFPKLEELYQYYKSNPDVKVYIVNCGTDSIDDVNHFILERNIKIPALYDSNGKLTNALNIDGFPYSVIIDRTGTIRFNHLGYSKDESDVYVRNTIDEINSVLSK